MNFHYCLLGALVFLHVIAGEEDNLILRIQDDISVDMSSQWMEFRPSFAVDGNEETLPNSCHCCAGTTTTPPFWWRLNLRGEYLIEKIVFIGRSDGNSGQSRGFSIYKGFSNSSEYQKLLYTNTATTGSRFIKSLDPPVALQRLEVTRSDTLTICELKLVEYECPDGQYGYPCENCGKCKDISICNKSNGICPAGCQPGYRGNLCYYECETGRFGQNCVSICHCVDNAVCNHISGRCPNDTCASGWKALDCNTECDDGTFGLLCQKKCHCWDQVPCEKVNGICPSGKCAKGWKGRSCSTKCETGRFGQNCVSICHCLNNAVCNHISGRCPNDTCAPGWKASDCNTECADGTFGLLCQKKCYCRDHVPCKKVNGVCPSGECAKGWKGSSCSTKCDDGTFGQDCLSACHCKNNATCDHVNGTCPNDICAPGWEGSDCNTECDDGMFGQDCFSKCHCLNQVACNKASGICHSGLCANGWRDINCSAECYEGTFGLDCSSICHCQNNVTCNHKVGTCPNNACAPGWITPDCSTECDDGRFGQDCQNECHCRGQVACDKIIGICYSGLCANGWTGNTCSTAADNQRMEENPPTGVITGTVIAVVLFAVIVTALIVYWRRKRNGNLASSSSPPFPTSNKLRTDLEAEHTYTNTTVVYEKDTTVGEPEHIYDGIASTDDGLPVIELWNVMKMAYGNGFVKLHEEFRAMHLNELQRDLQSAHPAKKKGTKTTACNERKVVLRDNGNPALTLLEAQYVEGYGERDKFIAAQGPTGETVNEFWEMVYQENAPLIIMLEGPLDHKKTQHVQYWPSEGKAVYGRITIKKIKFTMYSDHIIRKFVISKQNAEQRHITQMQFTGWPDDSVPDNAWQFVQFWRKSVLVVEKERGPAFVHGCISGSMGSYIALDNLFKQARTEGLIRPQDTIKELFKQSGDLIQTKEQYGFIHEAIAEALFVRAKPIKQKDFEEVFMSMSKEDTQLGKSGLAKQYEIICPSDTTYTGLQQRASDHVYSDLTTPGGDNPQRSVPFVSKTPKYPPNTITLKNYAQQDAFVLTTSTCNDSLAEELWILIETRKMKTVIRFQSNKEDQQPDQGSQAKYSVQLLESKRENNIVINSYAYKRKDSVKAEVKSVKEFVYLGWQTGEPLPSNVQSIIAFICTVQQWQPSVNENHPILLCCRPGVRKAELCFALLNEFDRLRSTGEVNLLETVKCMAEKDDQFVPSFDQYEFCHAVILEYIKNYDAYENV